MAFPSSRLRRLRATPALRALVRETTLDASDLVLPLFIKPGMVHGGQVKVMDFGIARRVQETLSTMSRVEVAGTPAYMAPEQEQGVGVGPAADLFALGVCAYEALSGQLPFPQGGIMAKIQGTYRPVTDNSLTPLPRSVNEPIARALDPMPGKRHASASAFVEALARSLS